MLWVLYGIDFNKDSSTVIHPGQSSLPPWQLDLKVLQHRVVLGEAASRVCADVCSNSFLKMTKHLAVT